MFICKAFPSAVLLLVLAGTPLSALDIRFQSETDVTNNFQAVAGSKAMSFVNEEGGVLRFTTADKLTFSRLTLVDRQQRPLGLAEGTVDVTFRFKEMQQSFGLIMRVTDNDANAYVFLVNLSESASSALRIFKVSPTATPEQEQMLVFKATKAIVPGEWYRLRVKISNGVGGGVKLEGEVLPESGGSSILAASIKDDTDPVNGPGEINLRFYATNVPTEIEVKKVSVTPDPTLLH